MTLNQKKNLKPRLLNSILDSLKIDYSLFFNITKALKSDVPLVTKEGGFIADGFNAELDFLRNLRNDELNHRDIAYDQGATKDGFYSIMDKIIKTGSKVSIKLSDKI